MSKLKSYILDIIFPRSCLGCGILLKDLTPFLICRQCLDTISFKNNFACAFCKSPTIGGKTCPFCAKNHFLDRLLVTTSYDNLLVKKILKTIKYRFAKESTADIASLMIKHLKKLGVSVLKENLDQLVFVPVPLSRQRLNWRGFNQAELIATQIARNLEIDITTDSLIKVRNILPQAEMPDRESRIANSLNVFVCTKPALIKNKTVLLIDDISTTGSTLNDCARALKMGEAKEVIGFVFARGELNKKSSLAYL